MTINKIPVCFYCNETFPDYKALARHIIENQSTHRKSIKWAASVLTDVQRLNARQDRPQRMALTDQDVANKEQCERQLSGEASVVMCACPHCQKRFPQRIEIEHLQNPTAWRKSGRILTLCDNCVSTKPRRYSVVY